MPSNPSPSRTLIADTLRTHRRAVVAWILGGTAAMYAIAAGFSSEAARYEGGAKAMAATIEAGAEALRLLRWPAERLDTLGGYLTYHNLTLFTFFLALYGATQGVGAIRGAEPRHTVEALLATGRSRRSLLWDRAVGFATTLAIITVGFGLGLAVSMAAGGEPDTTGSLLTATAAGLCAFAAYALGALLGELTATARSAKAASALVLTGLYLLTNVADRVGPFGVIRYVSPFHYFNESRALVPGHGFSVVAAIIVVALAVALLAGAGLAFERRDLDAPLWARAPRPIRSGGTVQRAVLRRYWTATLHRERVGLIAWSLATAATMAMMAWLEPSFEDMWDELGMTRNLFDNPSFDVARQYLAFAGEIITPVIAAFVITQAAGWIADLETGRLEIIFSTPTSWTRLTTQRLLSTLAGVTGIVIGGIVGLSLGAIAVDAPVDVAGMARLAADSLLFAAAFGALAALVVAWLRSSAAVTALALFAGVSYMLVLLVPMFAWPDWLNRLSLFGAFGHPYLEIPATAGLAFFAAVAVVATLAAVIVAEHAPKTAN